MTGLANADIWSEDEEEEDCQGHVARKVDKCGRGPWCGGGMRQPLKPLERLGNKDRPSGREEEEDIPPREIRGNRQKLKVPKTVGKTQRVIFI